MFKSLYARLALALVLLVLLMSVVYLLVSLQAGKLYSQELHQRLNQQLAANLIQENHLSIEQGRYDRQALEQVFHTYMVINPSIEVYLLDAKGRILSYSAPPGTVKRERVDLQPVQTFLAGRQLPIVGDDPRDPAGRKVFSVAPVGPPGRPQGYLYVVLTGQQWDSAAGMLQGSYILRLVMLALLISALAGVVGGLWFLRHVTGRLRQLDRAMTSFEAGGFTKLPATGQLDTQTTDELGRLARNFVALAGRISSQVDSLQQTDALRRELVANVSHDLRTPIASLQGYLETLLIKEGSLDAGQRQDYLRIALRHSERLGKLVSELFELAKLDSGHTEVHCEPFSLGELVQDVMLKYQLQAQRKQLSLSADMPTDLPFVCADIGLIERVLANLLDNAIRHTDPGGEVRLILQPEQQQVRVTVAETGAVSRPKNCRLCSTAFIRSIRANAKPAAESVWDWPSPSASWICIAVRSR